MIIWNECWNLNIWIFYLNEFEIWINDLKWWNDWAAESWWICNLAEFVKFEAELNWKFWNEFDGWNWNLKFEIFIYLNLNEIWMNFSCSKIEFARWKFWIWNEMLKWFWRNIWILEFEIYLKWFIENYLIQKWNEKKTKNWKLMYCWFEIF